MYAQNGVRISNELTLYLLRIQANIFLKKYIETISIDIEYDIELYMSYVNYLMATNVTFYDTMFTWVYNITNSQCIEFLS